MRARAVLVAGCLVTTAACSGSSGHPITESTSSSTVAASSTLPLSTSAVSSTTVSASTNAAPSTTAVATPVLASLPSGPCIAAGAAPPHGEITFTSSGRLYAMAPDGSNARCLYELNASEAGPIRWGPQADRVILGPANVAVGDAVNPSGFFATNGDVKWSLPEGTRTFAATVDGRLKKRGLTDFSPEEISFLKYHEASVYHPAGRAVVSVGTANDGTYGVFLADNNGLGVKPIAIAETARKITEPTFDQNGSTLFFIAEHEGTPADWHVHSVTFPDLFLDVAYESSRPLSDLVASTVGNDLAVRAGGCDPSGSTMLVRPFTANISNAPEFTSVVTKPVGFLENDQLVVQRFPHGCARPSELWLVHVWSSVGNPVDARLLVAGVDQAAVRTIHGPFSELPPNINPQAPG